MQDKVHFSVRYDGPALSNHTMDVRELAPALVAFSDLFQGASKAVFPDAPEVLIKVRGNFKAGSFGIDLMVEQSLTEQVVSLFSGKESTAIANLVAMLSAVGVTGGGLFGLIKWLRGRKPSRITKNADSVVFECQGIETTETITVDLLTGKLYESHKVRQSLVKVLAPLGHEGIDFFAVGKDGHAHTVVRDDELVFFTAAAEDEETVSDDVHKNVLLQIESAVFREGNKWRFADGGAAFYAEIADEDFLAKVNAGERFGKLDVLRVNLQRIQSITDSGLKIRHVITRVHEHREPLQGRLL